MAAQRRRRAVRPGRGRRRGQLHRPVPDGRTARHLPAIAALEAAIPDAAALVFACLGIALALHGRRALRARALNLASVAASVFMNAIAAEPGWRNLAIWAMPPVAYALASDTLIGVVRAWTLARHQHLTADAATPLAILGGLLLWYSAWSGPRLHPGRVPRLGAGRVPGRPGCSHPGAPAPHPGRRPRPPGSWIWSPNGTGLSPSPLNRVAGISADLAPQLDLNTGAARTALRKAVLAARNGDPR